MRLQVQVVPGGSPATAPAACSFLEIAPPTHTLEALCISISNRFERLYPHRPPLKIDKIQDSNGNDLDLGYLVSDVFSDKLEDNLNSIVRVLQKSTLRESSIPPESSLRPQVARKRRRLGTIVEVSSNASQEQAPSAHSSERGRMRERFPKRPRINDYVVQDSMDDREEGEEHWKRRAGHDNRFDAGHDSSGMVEVAATQQSGQLSPSLGNRTPSPEIAITGAVEHPGQVPFIEVKVEDKERAEEIQEIHYSMPYLPQEPGSAETDHHSSPILPPNPAQIIDIVTNGIRRSIYDIPTSSSSEDEPSLPVSSQNKKGRQRNGNSSQSPRLRKKRAEEARLAAEKAEKERAKEQAAAREKAVKAAEAREKVAEAERERLAKEKAEDERREKERKEAELGEQRRIAAEKLEGRRKEEERKRMEKAEHEARITAEKAEEEKRERERIENEGLAKEKAGQDRLAEEKREQERVVKEKAEREKAEREELEKERIQREKEEALNQKKEVARKRRLARAAEKKAQVAKERAEKLEREKAEKAERAAREKAEKAEKLEQEKAEKARKQAEYEQNNRFAGEARKQTKEKAKGPALNSSRKETPSSQSLSQPSQVLMTDPESPVPTPNSTLKRSNLKTKILEGSRKRSSVSFAEDLTQVPSPTPTGKKDAPAPVLGSKVTPILPPGYTPKNKLIAEAVVMKTQAKPAAEAEPPGKRTKLAILPPKPTTAKKASPQPSPVPAQAPSQGGAGGPALEPKPSPESDSESERSTDEDSGESGSGESDSGESDSEEEGEAKPMPKLSAVKKSAARVKSAKDASPLMALKPLPSPTNFFKTPPPTQQSSQRPSRSDPRLSGKSPIIALATPATETDSESSSGEDEEIGSASDSDFGPAPKTKPTTASAKTSKSKPTTTTNPSPPQSYRSLSDLEKMPVPDVHDIHSSQAPLNPSALPPPSGTVRKTHDGDDDSSEESSESSESSDEDVEVADKQVIYSAKKAAAMPAKKGGFLSNFWGIIEK